MTSNRSGWSAESPRLFDDPALWRTAARAADDRLAVLTEREPEVLGLVGRGLSNKEIGAELFVSPATAFAGSPPGRTTE